MAVAAYEEVSLMPENVTNDLLFEQLKAVRAELTGIREDARELRDRQVETHAAVLAVRRDQLGEAETSANLTTRVDRLSDRMARIERRLDLTDSPAE